MTTPHLYSALWCKPNTCHDSYNYPSLWNWFSSWKWAFICICATDRMCLEWLSYSINWYLWRNLCIISHWWTNHWRACRIWFFLCSILMFLLVDCLLKKKEKNLVDLIKIREVLFTWLCFILHQVNCHLCVCNCQFVGCIRHHFLSFDIYNSSFSWACRLFGFNAGKLRMDERIDLSMSDPDLVPLLIQVLFLHFFWVWNYIVSKTISIEWWTIGHAEPS